MHVPVMLNEIMAELGINKESIIVDLTLGNAGHTECMLEKLSDFALFIGIDRDKQILKKKKIHYILKKYSNKAKVFNTRYSYLPNILKKMNINSVDFILGDLGMSTMQISDKNRGFTFKHGLLDMRMDSRLSNRAYDVLEKNTEQQLSEIFYKYGGEKNGRNIARIIKKEWPIPNSTKELVKIINKITPYKSDIINSSTKIFQSLRIVVNKELSEIEFILNDLPKLLKLGGKILMLSFNSAEDKIIKNYFVKDINEKYRWRILYNTPLIPNKEELRLNPSSKSAKLRVYIKEKKDN